MDITGVYRAFYGYNRGIYRAFMDIIGVFRAFMDVIGVYRAFMDIIGEYRV